MQKLLELYFNCGESSEKLVLYTQAEGLENTGELSWIKIFYESESCSNLLYWNFFRYANRLQNKLFECLKINLQLHESIVKNIGYYENQYRKKDNRKNLVYFKNENGSFWVGGKYSLFSSCGKGNPDSWLYNDKDGNIVFELTPAYPWFYSNPEPGENFIKYSDWMKNYKPILKRVISKETAQEWYNKLQELTTLVEKVSKNLPCGGMLDCGGCIVLDKTND